MKNLRFRLTLLGGGLLMLAFSSMASAQATRTWVSGVGDDANPCSRTAPCKTFAGAISKTAPGGEIDCLDPGGFGALTITKSISIDCDTGPGGVLVAGTPGITVAAGATDVVDLRNINFQGLLGNGSNPGGAGTSGINIVSAKAVHLEDMVIRGFSQNGILVNATAAVSVTGRDVKVDNCGNGLNVKTTSGNAIADFDSSQFVGNTTGIFGDTGSLITIRNSIIAVSNTGVFQPGGGSQINILYSGLSSNSTATFAASGSTIRIVGNTFTQNGTAVGGNVASTLSDATNTNVGNGIVGNPSALPVPIKF